MRSSTNAKRPGGHGPPGLGGRRTYPMWLAAYAFAVVMLGTTLPTPLYPIYERLWGFSPLVITVIFAVYAAIGRTSTATGPIAVRPVARRRRVGSP